jgi:transposase
MDLRELKALEIAARTRITFDGSAWSVPSQSGAGAYRVTLGPDGCQCEDFTLRREPCKHVVAAKLVRERDGEEKAPALDTDAVPKKPTYRRDWNAYNLAQSTEKHRLQTLLSDLCRGVEEPPPPRTGRRRVSMSDRLFSIIFKAYCGLSTRRYNCDLQDAHLDGHISRPLHYSKVNAFITEPDLTDPLRGLVAKSAMPLRAVETRFAVDSSGFGTSKFHRWFDEKYGVHRSAHKWVKTHIVVGVQTGIVTAALVSDRDANDSPFLPPLMKATAASGFKVDEVLGDKGYLSAENAETVAELGGVPFIAPKVNTTGAAGGLFERMFHYYQFRREEFLRHYHQRSNVESAFSSIKRKFGDSIRARNPVAMTNEVLTKLVCYNLTRVILSQIELGIEPVFWGTTCDESRGLLPFRRA